MNGCAAKAPKTTAPTRTPPPRERRGDHYDRLADWHPWVNKPAEPAATAAAAPTPTDHTTSEEDHRTMHTTAPQITVPS